MALFRFTLDGNLLADEPEGWQNIVSELKRDKESNGQLLIMDLTLRFNGGTDGYNILKPLVDCQGFCSFSELKIEECCNNDLTFVTIYEGILFYTDVKEYLTPCVLECKLTDNSYFAKIDNNKSIEAYVNVGRSKNDVVIAPASPSIIFMFDVQTGGPAAPSTCRVYPVWECFKFIINYDTDGEMGFVSDYFSSGEGKDMNITTGEQIRLGHNNATIFPFISFDKLFDEVNKKTNIGFSIETVNGVQTMRIEPKSYFFNQNVSVTLNDVKGIVKSVNTAELYSKLEIGSNDIIDYATDGAGGCTTCFPSDISFVGFKRESFTLTGKCNIDSTLNLVSEWIIDSNVIQDILNGNTGYDDNIVFVMATGTDAIQYDVFFNGPPFFYNGFLRNSEVAIRWLGAVPNSIALYLGTGNNECMATKNTDTGPLLVNTGNHQIIYQDDFNPPNFDTNGNYDPVTGEYIAPASGMYSFQFLTWLKMIHFWNAPSLGCNFTSSIAIYNNLNVLQRTINVTTNLNFSFVDNVPFSLFDGATIYMTATEKARYQINLFSSATHEFFILHDSTLACVASATGGGIFQTYNPEDFKAYLYDFDFPLSFADFQTIKANPLKLLSFNDGVNFINAWIDNMKYDHKNGNSKFTCINSLPKTDC